MVEYEYWRNADSDVFDKKAAAVLADIHIGSTGAAANILAGILLGGRSLHEREEPEP